MNKWSNSICKTSISKYIIDELIQEYKKEIDSSILQSISLDIKDKVEYKELERAIKELKNKIREELYLAILEEQTEIKEDLQWIGTRRGKYIVEINNWQEGFYSEFRSKEEFENILIGGHTDRMVVFVTGEVNNREQYQRLLDYINSKKPPFKLLTQIEIVE